MSMQTITPTQIVNGLGDYLTSVHEFEAVEGAEHMSFYVDLYRQWKKVPPFTSNPTQSLSATLWQNYWERMGKWYVSFLKEKDKLLMSKMMFESGNTFYQDVIGDLQYDVLNRLPVVAKVSGNVVSMDQSIRLLEEQLHYLEEIDLEMQTIADNRMILEYWHQINKLIDEYQPN